MGKGIDLARPDAPEHAAVMDDFKDQLIIALMVRLADKNGRFVIPVKEVDETGRYVLAFSVAGGAFNFELRKKQ